MSILMVGEFRGDVSINPNPFMIDLSSKMKVTWGKDPVVRYIGYIDGNAYVKKDELNVDITFNLEVPQLIFTYDVSGNVNIDLEKIEKDIVSDVSINPENIEYIFDGDFTYEKEDLTIDLSSKIEVRLLEEAFLPGTVSIHGVVEDYDIPSSMKVEGIAYLKDMIVGNLDIEKDSYEENELLYGQFIYEKNTLDQSILDGTVFIANWNSWFDINCRIHVPAHRILYTFLSKLRAVRPCDVYLPSSITVINDQLYDIPAHVDLVADHYDDLVLYGNVSMYPFIYSDIDGTVDLDKIDTRKEFSCYLYAASRVDTDITFVMDVTTPYTQLIEYIPSKINVGNNLNEDLLSEMLVQAALQTNNEIPSSIRVTNDLMPGRIGIFVDPLWSYEPFVLKNTISTFFDRILNKASISIVYGGSPRANWDIHHFADIYRIPHYHQHEIPFEFNPTNPMFNRESMHHFIHALFHFHPREKHKRVDKVFVFSNNPYMHNATYLSPLYHICAEYRIPIVAITSKGEFVGTDPAAPHRYITSHPVDPNFPIDAQPHWTFGSGTKHRDTFDDHPIV